MSARQSRSCVENHGSVAWHGQCGATTRANSTHGPSGGRGEPLLGGADGRLVEVHVAGSSTLRTACTGATSGRAGSRSVTPPRTATPARRIDRHGQCPEDSTGNRHITHQRAHDERHDQRHPCRSSQRCCDDVPAPRRRRALHCRRHWPELSRTSGDTSASRMGSTGFDRVIRLRGLGSSSDHSHSERGPFVVYDDRSRSSGRFGVCGPGPDGRQTVLGRPRRCSGTRERGRGGSERWQSRPNVPVYVHTNHSKYS